MSGSVAAEVSADEDLLNLAVGGRVREMENSRVFFFGPRA